MKKKDPEEEALDLLHGNLAPEEARDVISGLKDAGIGEEELESIRKIDKLINNAPVGKASPSMDRRFYEMLADEKSETLNADKNLAKRGGLQISSFRAGLRIAAGIALFVLGWFSASLLDRQSGTSADMAKLSGELKDLKEALVLTMLNQNSALERIKAVNMVAGFENPDERIIESLLGALNHDTNDNVRLLAIEALIKYSDNPVIREGLVGSIRFQSSPMIQLRLAEVMIALNERKAVPEFQKVLMNAGLNYSVRNKINEAVTFLL